ncbi:hypothetical protein GCM10017782_10540 [Deinococcus ficus]|nr:hypothetical protein GCM10017782_10540 [Deinococcus ficus]
MSRVPRAANFFIFLLGICAGPGGRSDPWVPETELDYGAHHNRLLMRVCEVPQISPHRPPLSAAFRGPAAREDQASRLRCPRVPAGPVQVVHKGISAGRRAGRGVPYCAA